MTNEQRAAAVIKKYGFNFDSIPKAEIRSLIEEEILHFQEGSSEYIRLLCGYLYCIGDMSDVSLIEKAKCNINMDVGCMIDQEWLDSLKNGGIEDLNVGTRENIIKSFICYYKEFELDDVAEDQMFRDFQVWYLDKKAKWEQKGVVVDKAEYGEYGHQFCIEVRSEKGMGDIVLYESNGYYWVDFEAGNYGCDEMFQRAGIEFENMRDLDVHEEKFIDYITWNGGDKKLQN